MNAVWGSLVGGVFVALISGVFVLLGRRVDAKATKDVAEAQRRFEERVESRKVDLEEFREVQARNEKALDRADAAIARVESELAKEHEARELADRRAAAAEERAERAEQRALEVQSAAAAATRRLSRRIEQLEKVLTDHDMPVPPPD